MRRATDFKQVYVYEEFMDMRKDINALSCIAQFEMQADWSKPQLFVFMGKTKNLVKILYYDKTGFCVWKKRLEKDKYPWIKKANQIQGGVLSLNSFELLQVLEGVNIFSKHSEKYYELA